MNCFAHAIRFLDRDWFLVGTGLPDWLSMADRAVRLRPRHVDPIAAADSGAFTELARGVQQHWHDDDWFHSSVAFHTVSTRIGKLFRDRFDTGDNFRAGFLGHISLELLIDGVLAERNPDALDQYYRVVAQIDSVRLQELVNAFGARQTQAIGPFLLRYRQAEFLRDYVDDSRLLYRLNRVLARVRLPELPGEAASVIGTGRDFVREELAELVGSGILAAA